MSLEVASSILKSVCQIHGLPPDADPMALLDLGIPAKEVMSNREYVDIIKKSLPGAAWMYELLKERMHGASCGYVKNCFHNFEKVEIGHIIRACYGDNLNRTLNEHYGIVLKRVAPGRVVAFTPQRFAQEDARSLLFSLSGQNAHKDDLIQTQPIQDSTVQEIPVLDQAYPLAMQHLRQRASAAQQNGLSLDFDRKDEPLFRELVELLSIAPYRLLVEECLSVEFATVNCCNGGARPTPRLHAPTELHAIQWSALTSSAVQLLAQDPTQVDC